MFVNSKHWWGLNILLIAICSFLFVYLIYFLPRANFTLLSLSWFSLFAGLYILANYSTFSLKTLFFLGLGFRLLLLFAIPPLSQDFNRFIWDGRMLLEGFNPYLSTPLSFIEKNYFPVSQAQELFKAMGKLNASHYTNYPPVSQLGYLIAAVFGSKSILASVIIMRIQLIIADVGIFYFGYKILNYLKLPQKNILFYYLNPFIIIELTGNLHYEPVMIFFLVWSLYLLLTKKWISSAILLGVSINVKLLPLIFLPIFLSFFLEEKLLRLPLKILFSKLYIKRKKLGVFLLYCSIAIGINMLLFLPFFDPNLISNYGSSIGLWFKNFEFNASIYYIIRWIGFQTIGWNIIGIVGPILPIFVILFLFLISVFRNNFKLENLFSSMLFAISIHLFLTTTVHPWYLSIPLIISVFTKYKYVYIWTLVIIFSYVAYSNDSFKENLGLVTLEYVIVYGVLVYELFLNSKKRKVVLPNKYR